VLIALIWLLTVAGASTLTWGVISSAGAKVGPVTTIAAGATASSGLPSDDRPTASTAPTATSASSSSTKPSSKPTTSKPSDTPTAKTATETWTSQVGKVTASCRGSVVALISAVPSDGYRAQVDKEGTKLLKVEFERTGYGDDEDSELHLVVTCIDGNPSFRHD
jgi:hypothetical protein